MTHDAPRSGCRVATSNVGARMATTATIVAVILTLASAAGAANPRQIALAATFTAGPDATTSYRCVPASVPSTCHGTAEGAATYSGGWSGTSHYVYKFLIAPSGTVTVEITERFEGSVEGCGTGTFTVLSRETIEPSGTAHGRWVIPAIGTDDFKQLTGTGTSTGSYAPDGTGTGGLTGRLVCQG